MADFDIRLAIRALKQWPTIIGMTSAGWFWIGLWMGVLIGSTITFFIVGICD
jgi:hypothetical protein